MAPHPEVGTVTVPRTEAPAAPPPRGTLLAVEGLTVAYGEREVVHDVSFSMAEGESLALIGESGSGKTTVARTVLRLLPGAARVTAGAVTFAGRDVTALGDREFRPLRGAQIGFVPQDPANALNPVRGIGVQAHETAALLRLRDKAAEKEAILQAFAQVGLPDPERVYRSHPHQLSGGMLQRVLIGLAVLPRPTLLVADEPTSGLDVTIQKVVLDLLSGLRRDLGLSLLFITHDLAIAAERADSLVVLKDGVVKERGSSQRVLSRPESDYARELQADVPAINPHRYRAARAARPRTDPGNQVELRAVTKSFAARGGPVTAVDDVSIVVPRGTTHALVGESGSGKTTTARLLLGLESPDAGEIVVGADTLNAHSTKQWRAARRHLQLVYQNPFTSLDPTWKVERIVREPLDRYGIGPKAERRLRVAEALEAVGLSAEMGTRRPGQLSGGQRQRVAIARALAIRPDVLVLDEPTSALDVTVQASIMELLVRLQHELGLTYVFVSHDLSLVRQIADTVTVLRDGAVIENGAVEEIFSRPEHEYTRALLDAIPAVALADAAADGLGDVADAAL
ncbi:ABC transporter ATP-binding protein [Patulibacter sp. NPDC049589]|uniref:ABC transporter ATP-binding protein n=1 Tax=Patulibacter sp. NPDC049589 TaxID=3154731 RepID=UPI003415ED1F